MKPLEMSRDTREELESLVGSRSLPPLEHPRRDPLPTSPDLVGGFGSGSQELSVTSAREDDGDEVGSEACAWFAVYAECETRGRQELRKARSTLP